MVAGVVAGVPGDPVTDTGMGHALVGTPHQRGRLEIFLGVAPGAGKTYAMLEEGSRLAATGLTVVVGLVETHGRHDIDALRHGLPEISLRPVGYRDTVFEELDVDAIIDQHPDVALVDELAHRCVPGSRHEKRWEDVEELLDAGIDVVTSLNVQHLDSLSERVETITGVPQSETVPDAVVAAGTVRFVDVTPDRLRTRLAGASGTQALGSFFNPEHLVVLRRIGLRWMQDHGFPIDAAWPSPDDTSMGDKERVVVALTGGPESEHVLRRASQIALASGGALIGVYVRVPSDTVSAEPSWLSGQRRLLSELGGRYAETAGIDVATVVLELARSEHARHLVMGATRRTRWEEILHGSVINKAIRSAGQLEVHVIPPLEPPTRDQQRYRWARDRGPTVLLPGPRRATAWSLAAALPVLVTVALIPARSSLELAGVLLCNLLAVVTVALLGGFRPALLATVLAFAACDFFYAPPFYSLRVGRLVDLIALVTFLVVALAMGILVDLLTRQGVRVARATAEAHNLARLAARSLVTGEGLPETIAVTRRIFDLDGVAAFRRQDDQWHIDATAGEMTISAPNEATVSVDIGGGRVLAMAGERLSNPSATLLRAFLDELRHAREQNMLRELDQADAATPDGE